MQVNKKSKYPEECASIKRQQTFSVTPRFVLAKSADGEDPAKLHNSNFSRVDFTIIDKDKTFVNSTVKFASIPGIICASQYAYTRHMGAIYEPQLQTTGTQNPAFSMKFFSGSLKGKTVAQVALEEGEEVLKKQYDWLKENIEKYPKNKNLMDAINETVKALRDGKLTNETAVATSSASYITVYDAMKGNPHKPLKEGSNLFFVHDFKIRYYLGDNYPVNVTIKNYYAPIHKEESGQQKIDYNGRDKSTEHEVTMKLTADEWNYIIYQIRSSEERFSYLNASAIEKDIRNSVDGNKKAAENNMSSVDATDKEETTEYEAEKENSINSSVNEPEAPQLVTYKVKTTVPMAQTRSGSGLAIQAKTEAGELKDILFLNADIEKVDPSVWSKFLNRTKKEGCIFTAKFEVTTKGTLIFRGF